MNATVYNQEGKKTGTVDLPADLFGAPWKADLVHQVATSMQANRRGGNAHTKDRSEVRGGGKKPWRQKGTGRARHGSSRSPIWIGGGVTHGPTNEKVYSRRVPRRMAQVALASVLSKKYGEGEVFFLDALKVSAKTREAKNVILSISSAIKGLESLSKKKNNALLVAVPKKTTDLTLAFRNVGNIELTDTQGMNVLSLLTKKFCVIVEPENAISVLTKRIETPKRTKSK